VAIFGGIVPDAAVLAVATTTLDRELYSQVRLRLLAGAAVDGRVAVKFSWRGSRECRCWYGRCRMTCFEWEHELTKIMEPSPLRHAGQGIANQR
jgi:hypothetical protein